MVCLWRAFNHPLTAPLCQALVPRFYSTILILKGNKSKRRDSVPPIIMLQHMFYCWGFNTNKIHSLGTSKWLTYCTQICFQVAFSIPLVCSLAPPTHLAFLASCVTFSRMKSLNCLPKRTGLKLYQHSERRWKMIPVHSPFPLLISISENVPLVILFKLQFEPLWYIRHGFSSV